jgi:hypothetical protein
VRLSNYLNGAIVNCEIYLAFDDFFCILFVCTSCNFVVHITFLLCFLGRFFMMMFNF